MSGANSESNLLDILRPLTELEVDELLALYQLKYGSHNFHYILLYNQRKWDKQLSADRDNGGADSPEWISLRKTFYTHRNCDFRRFGTYVSLHYDLMQSVSFNSWQSTLQELKECLQQTQLIKWHTGPLLTNVDLIYCELVKNIALDKGASVQRARRCYGVILPHDRALQLIVPPLGSGYALRSLQLSDAVLVHSMWTNAKEGSLQYIRALIRYNKTLGIYKTDDDQQTLIAWIFQNDFSGLGILQVEPNAQRQGFGSLLATALSKEIAANEQVSPSAWFVEGNFRSEGLLAKIGYEKTVMNEWIQLEGIK